MDLDVESLVCSDVDVPVNGCSVVACGDYFACFAHHDYSFGTHGGGVFTVGYAVLSFIFVALVCPCSKV